MNDQYTHPDGGRPTATSAGALGSPEQVEAVRAARREAIVNEVLDLEGEGQVHAARGLLSWAVGEDPMVEVVYRDAKAVLSEVGGPVTVDEASGAALTRRILDEADARRPFLPPRPRARVSSARKAVFGLACTALVATIAVQRLGTSPTNAMLHGGQGSVGIIAGTGSSPGTSMLLSGTAGTSFIGVDGGLGTPLDLFEAGSTHDAAAIATGMLSAGDMSRYSAVDRRLAIEAMSVATLHGAGLDPIRDELDLARRLVAGRGPMALAPLGGSTWGSTWGSRGRSSPVGTEDGRSAARHGSGWAGTSWGGLDWNGSLLAAPAWSESFASPGIGPEAFFSRWLRGHGALVPAAEGSKAISPTPRPVAP